MNGKDSSALRALVQRYRAEKERERQLAELNVLRIGTAEAIAQGERVKAQRAAAAERELAHKHDVPEDLPAIEVEMRQPLPAKLSPSRQKHPVKLRTGKVPR